MNLLDIIVTFWQTMLQLLWFSKKSISNTLSVYVKSYTGSTVSVDLDPKWDIKNVKQVVASKLGLQAEEVKIIFAGKELDDSTIIEECDLGEQSILHAVRSKTSSPREGSKPLNEILTELKLNETISEIEDNVDEETTVPNKAHFYVFCTSPCNAITTGKLRVRCTKCRSGAITVDSDPASWSDVLQPHRISGHCEAQNCPDGAVAWAQFYFKCAEHTSEGENDQAVPLYLIRDNSRQVPCLACTDVREVVLVFGCGHVTCLDCFRDYCTSRLRERRFTSNLQYGYTLPCPANCENSLIEEPHHFRILPLHLYSQYQKFGAEEFVLNNGGVLCPQPGCGAGIMPDAHCNKVICMSGCGYVFCKNCLQGYHIGECNLVEELPSGESSTYSVDPTRVAQAHWNEASRVTIKVMTKPCPKCRTPTERDGGCMHMVCPRCNYEWCWVCQVEWTRACMGSHWFG